MAPHSRPSSLFSMDSETSPFENLIALNGARTVWLSWWFRPVLPGTSKLFRRQTSLESFRSYSKLKFHSFKILSSDEKEEPRCCRDSGKWSRGRCVAPHVPTTRRRARVGCLPTSSSHMPVQAGRYEYHHFTDEETAGQRG